MRRQSRPLRRRPQGKGITSFGSPLFRTSWCLCFLLRAAFSHADDGDTVSNRPNVLVILADDQGWGDLRINGNNNLETPNIDSLARDGASLDRFFVCPVCSPTRAEFLTGRFHPRGGVYSTSAGGERLNADEETIAQLFKRSGYSTAAFGKWHNGTQYPYHPNARGFDEFYGFCSGHWGHYYSPMLDHNGEIVQGNGYLTDDFTTRLIQWTESRKEPWFAYLAFNTPHSPMQVPDEWWDRKKDHPLPQRHRDPQKEDVGHTKAALAMVENIDFNVGRILQSLERSGDAENTIVVYFTDNGPNGSRWNGRMKGRKGSTDEGGVRSPLFIRWPAGISRGLKVSPTAAVTDLLPTLTDLAGVSDMPKKSLDGRTIAPLLRKQTAAVAAESWADRPLVSHWRNRISVRTQRYRLDHQGQLFDMLEDPEQRQNVADQLPEVTVELQEVANAYRRNVLSELGTDDRPFVFGHPAAGQTHLPARDALFSGEIKRSNRFPNDSFLTNWRSVDDEIRWEGECLASGMYEVSVYYTCDAADTGSRIRFSSGDAAVTARVDQPAAVELLGAAEDRVPRMESYVQNFRPLTMGRIRLQKGQQTLRLTADQVAGDRVMDFRLLVLRPVQAD